MAVEAPRVVEHRRIALGRDAREDRPDLLPDVALLFAPLQDQARELRREAGRTLVEAARHRYARSGGPARQIVRRRHRRRPGLAEVLERGGDRAHPQPDRGVAGEQQGDVGQTVRALRLRDQGQQLQPDRAEAAVEPVVQDRLDLVERERGLALGQARAAVGVGQALAAKAREGRNEALLVGEIGHLRERHQRVLQTGRDHAQIVVVDRFQAQAFGHRIRNRAAPAVSAPARSRRRRRPASRSAARSPDPGGTRD